MPELEDQDKDNKQLLQLLSDCEAVKGKFTANEFEMYSHIKEKYEKESEGAFDDKICLEVMLRNISIRKDLAIDKEDITRIIDVEKKG